MSKEVEKKKKKLTGETASCILGLCEVQAVGIHYAIHTIIISLFIETINPQDLICLYMCCTFFCPNSDQWTILKWTAKTIRGNRCHCLYNTGIISNCNFWSMYLEKHIVRCIVSSVICLCCCQFAVIFFFFTFSLKEKLPKSDQNQISLTQKSSHAFALHHQPIILDFSLHSIMINILNTFFFTNIYTQKKTFVKLELRLQLFR